MRRVSWSMRFFLLSVAGAVGVVACGADTPKPVQPPAVAEVSAVPSATATASATPSPTGTVTSTAAAGPPAPACEADFASSRLRTGACVLPPPPSRMIAAKCEYPDGVCSCEPYDRGGASRNGRWTCESRVGPCPATYADAEAASKRIGRCLPDAQASACRYPQGTCACQTETYCGGAYRAELHTYFTCDKAQPGCPVQPLADGAACPSPGLKCNYRCNPAECTAAGWKNHPFLPP